MKIGDIYEWDKNNNKGKRIYILAKVIGTESDYSLYKCVILESSYLKIGAVKEFYLEDDGWKVIENNTYQEFINLVSYV